MNISAPLFVYSVQDRDYASRQCGENSRLCALLFQHNDAAGFVTSRQSFVL